MPGCLNMSRVESDEPKSDYYRDICFACGKPGHWARDCTENEENGYYNRRRGGYQSRGVSRGRIWNGYITRPRNAVSDACYKCGRVGHFARECESEFDYNDRRAPAPRRSDYCYRCGLSGHIARDCPSNQNTCYNCHKEGHLARDCPEDNECYRCGKPGHLARQCLEDSDRFRGGRGGRREPAIKQCYICNSTDHIQAKCPEAVCYRCHKEGHIARDCPGSEECYNCGRMGHVARDCPEQRCDPEYEEEEEDGNDPDAKNGEEVDSIVEEKPEEEASA